MKQSNALWPAGVCSSMYGDNISSDTHQTEEQAQAVCDGLFRDGFGGQGERFPIKTWVSDVQDPPQLPVDDEYYLQDSRSYVGNDVLFWAKNGAGYTTDVRKAQVFSKEEAIKQHKSRIEDIPWPKSYIDAKTRPAVDMQYINVNEALKDTGIVLTKPEKFRKESFKCNGCGQFMTERQFFISACENCGTDNRP